MSDATLSKEMAQAFWAQMAQFSARVYTSLGLPAQGSPNGDAHWHTLHDPVSKPTGAALHWTAADSLYSTLKWFCDPKSNVSAHMVVADRRLPWAEEMAQDLPLVAALPATAVMARPPTSTAWHVRNMDGCLFGIENQNVGQLSGRDTTLGWTSGGRTYPYRSDKAPVTSFGMTFEPYTLAQLQTNVDLLRYIDGLYGGSLQRTHVLGHSCWQSPATNSPREDKRDPGPLFPIVDIREAVFTPGMQTLPAGVVDPAYPLAWRAHLARKAMLLFREKEGRYNEAALQDIMQTQDAKIWTAFVIACSRPRDVEAYPSLALAMMACLGFSAGPEDSAQDMAISTRLAQRLVGVAQDNIIGPKTALALSLRFRAVFVGS